MALLLRAVGTAVVVLTLLAGCESAAPVRAVADPAAAWRAHQAELARIEHWVAVGKVGVRSGDEAWSASMRWEQDGERFRVRLSGPFGQGLVQVEGRPGHVELRTSERDVETAAHADELVRMRTGLKVPVSILRYWLLGRAEPGLAIDDLVLDAGGRLQRLRQAGWVLEVERYGDPEPVALPTKLKVENGDVQARLVVSSWKIVS